MPADRRRDHKSKSKHQPYKAGKFRDKKRKDKASPLPSTAPEESSTLSVPGEVIQNILKYTDTPTLARCLRVSKVFYDIAAPLLYSNVTIKDGVNLTQFTAGDRIVAPLRVTRSTPAVVNLKTALLAMVRQLTLEVHSCDELNLSSKPFPKLKTFRVVPDPTFNVKLLWWFDDSICEILHNTRPEKLVIYDLMLPALQRHRPPVAHSGDRVTCPILTLLSDEALRYIAPLYDPHYRPSWAFEEVRVIISALTPKLNKTTGDGPFYPDHFNFYPLANFLYHQTFNNDPPKIYIFRDFGSEGRGLESFKDELGGIVDKWYKDNGRWPLEPKRPTHVIKTLNDYIEEGVEDELPPEQLEYWRKENQRRMDRDKAELAEEAVDQSMAL